MKRPGRLGTVAGIGLAAALIVLAATSAHAQGAGPFGVGAPEAGAAIGSNPVFIWIAERQSEFYRSLTSALKLLRSDPHAGLILVGLSIAYGVFHAAGPGHGKAVISSYLIANRETLRRGILLSYVSSLGQGLVAIVFVGIARFVLDVTAREMTFATMGLEISSAVMITALGAWLVATKVFRLFGSHAHLVVTAEGATMHVHDANCVHSQLQVGGGLAGPASGPFLCTDCGDFVEAAALEGRFDWRRALGAIAAVSARPCSGAIIVLVFAFSQQLFLAGAVSVFAMAVGTGTTVAALASLAVLAKDRAVGLAGADGRLAARLVRGAEILAAIAVLVFGLLLLGASLSGAGGGG
ncbi:MAG: nickel/cobalt transporter [Ancalomicrobiaceae bacterium]|nr:nickel/cobalt transporter [Ancalomicrobiaceae bacterium]